MVAENPTWGAPCIHGELKMLGFDISERSVLRCAEEPWARQALGGVFVAISDRQAPLTPVEIRFHSADVNIPVLNVPVWNYGELQT